MESVASAAGIADRDYVDTSPRGLAALTRDAVKVAVSSPMLFLGLSMVLYFPFESAADALATTRVGVLAQLNAYVHVFRIVELFVGTFVSAAVLVGAKSMLESGAPPTLRTSLEGARARYGSFLVTTWSATWRIGLWTLCFIVPGIIMMVRYSLALSACAMEGLSGPDALRRSEELVRGQGWRVFFLGLGAVVLFALVAAAPTLFVDDDAPALAQALAASPGNALLPLLTIGSFLLYLDTARVGGFRPVRNLRAGDAPVSSGRLIVAAVVAVFVIAFTGAVLTAEPDPSGAVPQAER